MSIRARLLWSLVTVTSAAAFVAACSGSSDNPDPIVASDAGEETGSVIEGDSSVNPGPDGATDDAGESQDGQSVLNEDASDGEAHTKDAEAHDAEAKDAEAKDAEAHDAEAHDAEAKDAETHDADAKDAQVEDAEAKDAEVQDAEAKDAEANDAEGDAEAKEDAGTDGGHKDALRLGLY